jgi:hypothetical protein
LRLASIADERDRDEILAELRLSEAFVNISYKA